MTTHDLIAAELLDLGAATLGETGGKPMRARLRAAWPGAALAAPALPVVCTAGDNLAVHVAVANAPANVALVVSVGDQPELGYWGEVLTIAAQSRGVSGLVIDGCVRDVARLEHHRFPVFSVGIALPGATKNRAGSVGSVASVGDVDVHKGDWIVGDRDGVTVVPVDTLQQVIDAGRARTAKEDGFFAALRAGRTTVELLDLDPSPITLA
ncbi:MAG: Dimethylmenaquinone methyltransferase [Actinomycetia bacterium]|nr:Dimethylmenaquinone methyltransferase [Actinomycetes bacterium]